jgi:DnaB-like helicase C terminal domain
MIDNIQRLCDTTIGNRNRTQYLSEISKTLSQICKDYNVNMIRVIQPHQIGQGRIINSRDVDGASQIGKDCDCMLVLHRNRINEVSKEEVEKGVLIETKDTFAPEMLVTVGLSRYSAGGSKQVYYSGATSTVLPLNEGNMLAMKAMKKSVAVGYEAQAKAKNMSEIAEAAKSQSGEDDNINV